MTISSILQLSLISEREWSSLFSRVDRFHGKVSGKARSLSITIKDILNSKSIPPFNDARRRVSDLSDVSGLDQMDFALYNEAMKNKME